ncbi:MAG: phosphate ABC transporter permease PstA [Anaerolineae bacterium]|nr:phosphate ABC transporter permease PstA [Anaerolineae bacterium]
MTTEIKANKVAAAGTAAAKITAQARSNLQQRHLTQKLAFGMLWATGGSVIVILFFVLGYLLVQSVQFFLGAEPVIETAVEVDSNEAVREEVAQTPNAIGYLSFGYLDATVRPVSLNDVAPTTDNVLVETYPLARTLYLVANGAPAGAAAVWLDFARSSAGQSLVAGSGYIPLRQPAVPQMQPDALSGDLTIAGSTSMQPLAEALAQAFSAAYPGVTLDVTGGDSTAGIKEAGKGSVDIGMTSREVKESELMRYKDLQSFAIGYDGIAVVVNPALAVSDLTYNQVRDIFSGAVTNWKQVGGPDEAIVVVSRESGSGTSESFERWVMGKDALIRRGFQRGDAQLVFQGLGAGVKFVWRFLTEKPQAGMGGKGGISTTIVTTLYMVILTLAIATPVGVGAAVYLVEYAGEMSSQGATQRRIAMQHRVVEIIRFAVETLAGVPSILYGLFGFALFVTVMKLGLSMLSGALAGACLILPVIIRTTEEALLTVPRAYREGSLALGATQWQTNWQVVLPAAMPGIVTGVVLGVGRIVSETAVFYVTLGGSIHLPTSVMDQGRTMVLHLYSLMMDANAPAPAMGTAMVLVVAIIGINLTINGLSGQMAKRMEGK